jgi:cysteine desulfurase/selenocysteine lyase
MGRVAMTIPPALTAPDVSDAAVGDAVRELFPRFGTTAFLNHAAVARASEPVREAIVAMADRMATPGYADALALADTVRANVARLIGASSEAVAITRSTSHGISILANGLAWAPGDNVVCVAGDYPSNVYPWMALERHGVQTRFVDAGEGRATPDRILAAVDEHTRVVAVSHVQFQTGMRLDVAALGAGCRAAGALLCVDAMQSVGAIPIDVEAMQIDVLASGAWKWILGPAGIAFCYIRPSLLRALPPLIPGALTVEHRLDFARREPRWADDAHRFEETWISLPDLAGFNAALELALAVGVERIERRLRTRMQRLVEGLVERGARLVGPWPRGEDEGSGIVSFAGARPAAEVLEALAAADVLASQRGDFVRLSPHYYTPDRELDRALDAVDSLGGCARRRSVPMS